MARVTLRSVIIGALAAVFAYAGVAKMLDPFPIGRVITFLVPSARDWPGVTAWTPGVLAGAEVALAAMVLLDPRLRRVALAGMAALLVLFMPVLGVLACSPGAPSCGCFGGPGLFEARAEAAAGIARNIGLLCLIAWSWRAPPLSGIAADANRVVRRGGRTGTRSARLAGGFTLVELLIVIVLIALLVSLALPALGRARAAAREHAATQTIRQLNASLALYTHDYAELYPFFATPGKPFGPIEFRGFNVGGQYFQTQRWYWASAVVPDYFSPRTAIEPVEYAENLKDMRGYPEWIVASLYHVTSTMFAHPEFWRGDRNAVSLDDLRHLRPTRAAMVRFPAQKGIMAQDLAGGRGTPAGLTTAVAAGDASARQVNWKGLDRSLVVKRPWGAAQVPIASTRDGLAGFDWR